MNQKHPGEMSVLNKFIPFWYRLATIILGAIIILLEMPNIHFVFPVAVFLVGLSIQALLWTLPFILWEIPRSWPWFVILIGEQPDLMIGLFHAGVDYSYNHENENTFKNENASRLVAEKVDGFDVVFVGHDHTGWNIKTKNPAGKEVLILGTTSGARNIAVANYTLSYDKICMTYDKKDIKGELIEIKNYPPDVEFMNRYKENLAEVKNYVSRSVGEFTEMISSRDAMFGPSKFVDLIQTIQLDLTGADVSFSAPLSFNAKIDKGTVYVKDMFDLYRYENLLYTMELTGQEIKDYLEYSYGNWFNQMNDENDHLLKFKLDETGNLKYSERSKSPELEERYYNYESAAGIDYIVDVTKPVGSRVTIKNFSNGNPFDLNYKIQSRS